MKTGTTGSFFDRRFSQNWITFSMPFPKVNFSGSNLVDVNWVGANFHGALYDQDTILPDDLDPKFEKMVFVLNIQPGKDLSSIKFKDTPVNLKNKNLTKVSIHSADLSGYDFTHSDLSSASLTGSNLTGARLVEIKASSADFENAILDKSNLKNATLGKSNFKNAILTQANL